VKEEIKIGYGCRLAYVDIDTSHKWWEGLVRQQRLEEVDDAVGMAEYDGVVQPPH